jgi:hypothetical protein
MNKRLLQIFTFFILATPCLHAGFGSFISSILPDKMRASAEIRSHADIAVNHLKIQRPVFIINKTLEIDTLGATENNLLYSIIYIDNDQIKNISEYAQLHTAYHEMGHVAYDHCRTENALKSTTLNGYFFNLLISSYAIINRHRLTSSSKHKLFTVAASSLLGSVCAYANLPNYSAEETIDRIRERELQAEKVAFELTVKTHGTANLEKRLEYLKKLEATFAHNHRDRGDEYPTIAQETTLLQEVLQSSRDTSQ